MDTTIRPIIVGADRRSYQRHALCFKRELVAPTLVPGASLARLAREHGSMPTWCSHGTNYAARVGWARPIWVKFNGLPVDLPSTSCCWLVMPVMLPRKPS